ncbi:NnrS family protein [uncultured Shewanella sp.]|uniref:NnrS family protein n=1 Tax=uncultured Shewanella sp. TaxID=173975 RepID=UPI002608BA6E|nr:NnrS family protein [uncultured Shewanella sp.]
MGLINLTEPASINNKGRFSANAPLWMLAFRPFFLGGSLVALFGISYWTLVLSGAVTWSLNLPPNVWHAHEMMFGFASVIAMGFLLTAAQTWTGVSSISGTPLIILSCFWLMARVLFFVQLPFNFALGEPVNLYLVIVFQGIWWLGGIMVLSKMLFKARNKQNYPFIGILTLLFIFNMLFLYLVIHQQSALALKLCDTSVFIFILLIGIVAGRVIPFFTARGLKLTEQVKCPRLDRCILFLTMGGILSSIGENLTSDKIILSIFVGGLACLHLLRSFIWWNKGIVKVPLLWSLQLAYFTLGVGLIGITLSFYHSQIFYKDALHMVTIGAIGMMIIAMMARVSLGHTGRALSPPYFISIAFVCIFIAAIARSILPSIINANHAWILSGCLWSLGFFLFLFHYFPILINKRIDGRIG